MNKQIYLVFIALSIVLTGCVSQQELQRQKTEETKKIMDSWLESHKSSLIQSWGPPTRYDSDGQDGEILIYEYSRTVGGYAYGNYMQRTFVDYKEIFVNKEGIIYFYRTGTR
jgi:hypothetical protein